MNIKDELDSAISLAWSLKGLGMAAEDMANPVRLNPAENMNITHALGDAIQILSDALASKLEALEEHLLNEPTKQASVADIEALASDGRIPADMAGAILGFMNSQPAH